jgi:protoporphyrinogen oxidase
VKSQRWCVVGGGMLGLSLARSLALAGQRVEVWEAGEDVGGLAAPWSIGDIVWDRFYHVITSQDTSLLKLLGAINLERDVRWTSPQTGFYTDGRLFPLSSLFDFLRFPPLTIYDTYRLGTTILKASRISDYRALERIAAVDWLTELSGRRIVDRIWLPLLRAKLGCNAERVSAAFIWAIIKRMYGARKGRSKRELFGYVPGGYRSILDHLASHLIQLGVTMYGRKPVREVVSAEDGTVLVDDGASRTAFDRVAVTAPAPIAAQICTDLLPNERTRLLDVEYQGVVCASALLKRPLSPYYITNITDPASFTAIIEMDAVVDPRDLGGNALVYLPKYVPSNDPWFEREDEAIRREFVAGLNRIHPSFGMKDVIAFRIARARHVLPIATLGYSERVPPFTTSYGNVYIVNSTQIVNGTLNVNQTLELSERAFTCIQSDAGGAKAPLHVTTGQTPGVSNERSRECV